MTYARLLVVSLGNQAPYYHCRHSAGHFALAAAQKVFEPNQPPFNSERVGGKVSAVSTGQRYIFIQSPTMMNNCGPWIKAAWVDILRRENLMASEVPIILVHDDLEAKFGNVRVRQWDSSAQGHRGVISAKKALDSSASSREGWARIMIGIGRPKDRSVDVISDYVLGQLSETQKEIINDEVGPEVVNRLLEISKVPN
ncbi:peptidyl-tRNA hydrolase [Xylaria intraflava]|nr:peptidyl-tRNA hydrolase [Xylaria intraflava]